MMANSTLNDLAALHLNVLREPTVDRHPPPQARDAAPAGVTANDRAPSLDLDGIDQDTGHDGIGRDRDLPLSLHWEATGIDLAVVLGLPPLPPKQEFARNAILIQAIVANRMGYPGVSYGRRRAFFANKQRHYGRAFSFCTILPIIDTLGHFLLECHRAPAGTTGHRQSTFCASPQLLQAVTPALLAKITQAPRDPVRFRDANKHCIDYQETEETARMRRVLNELNGALGATSIEYVGTGVEDHPNAVFQNLKFQYRIFNNDLFHGGRFYGPWWVCAPKAIRQLITLDSEPVVELDHRQLHPRLLYRIAGAQLVGDAYILRGWDRNVAKVGFNILINAPTYQSALGAIAARLTGDDWRNRAARLIDDLKARHDPIRKYFHSGVGLRLQAIDADMAEMTIVRLLGKGVVPLSVHDSFLVQNPYAGLLKEAMETAFACALRRL